MVSLDVLSAQFVVKKLVCLLEAGIEGARRIVCLQCNVVTMIHGDRNVPIAPLLSRYILRLRGYEVFVSRSLVHLSELPPGNARLTLYLVLILGY